jgi:hypothetical protein
MEGLKNDRKDKKLRWELLPLREIEDVIKILMMGAEKYADFNWQKLDNLKERYWAAAMRHLSAWKQGEKYDKESGLSHLAHGICCLLFCLWKEKEEEKEIIQNKQ